MAQYHNQSQLYKYHVENLRSLEIAISNTSISARKAIADKNLPAIESFTRLYAFLLGAWAETRLHKLLNENGAFTDQDKEKVFSQRSQLNQWHKTVEVSYRKYFNIPRAPLSLQSLPHTAFHRLNSITSILDDDLKSIIEVRNKLAHGQWVYPLNSTCTDLQPDKYSLINNENLLSLQFKKSLITTLANIVHDLAVSLPTFERDFDNHFGNIVTTRNNLRNRSYDDYRKGLVAKKRRGVEVRRA
jgi:hypothetical protein